MSGEPITTYVATLLYRETMGHEFLQIVAEFNEAFRNRPQLPYSFGRPYNDFAVFDIEGAHIVIAHGDTADAGAPRGPHDRAVIALTIGAVIGDEPMIAARFQRLLRSIIGRIQKPYPAEAVLWSTQEGEFDPDCFDNLIAEVAAADAGPIDAGEQATAAAPPDPQAVAEPPPVAEPTPLEASAPTQPAAMDAPAHPPQQTHATDGAARTRRPPNRFEPVDEVVCNIGDAPVVPNHPTQRAASANTGHKSTVANTVPDIPFPMLTEAARIRRALYPEAEQVIDPPTPLPQRLTIYTLNTGLILVAMPLGVAVLTYNVLGRESMTVTARSMALAGFGFAITHTTEFGQALLAMI
ncbi:MAG: hypothetical protein K0B00_07945 [Rhodobacteraceae bacterium]|nr:hypothetical protein [Paracoccaceae bacterium]